MLPASLCSIYGINSGMKYAIDSFRQSITVP